MTVSTPADADECVGNAIALETYGIASAGGGILDIDQEEFSRIISRCEKDTDSKVVRYEGYQRLIIRIDPM